MIFINKFGNQYAALLHIFPSVFSATNGSQQSRYDTYMQICVNVCIDIVIITTAIYCCTVRICQPLNKLKGITAIKGLGETFKFHCSSSSHNERAGDIYNFTKLSESTGELESIYQGKEFSKTITNYSDAGTYCCAPQYANSIESCCYHITGN